MGIQKNLLKRLKSDNSERSVRAYEDLMSAFEHVKKNLPNTMPYYQYKNLLEKHAQNYQEQLTRQGNPS